MTVREFITEKGFLIVKLAKLVGVHRSTMSLALNGWACLSDSQNEKLANLIGISVEELRTNCVDASRLRQQ